MSDWDAKVKAEDQSVGFFLKGMKTLWELTGDQRKLIGLVLGYAVILQLSALAVPYFLKLIFDELPEVLKTGSISASIVVLLLAMLGMRLLILLFRLLFEQPTIMRVVITLENRWPTLAHNKLLNLSFLYHERENTGRKISKISKGCERLVDILGQLYWTILPNFLFLVMNLALIVAMDWKIGLILVPSLFLSIWLNLRNHKKFFVEWEKYEALKERSSGYFFGSLVNLKTVQNFVREEVEAMKYAGVRKEMGDVDFAITRKIQRRFFFTNLILNLGFVGAIVAGVCFAVSGQSTIGTVVFVVTTGNVTINNLGMMLNSYVSVMRNLVPVERMKQLLDEEPDIVDKPGAVIPDNCEGRFVFDKIKFVYPNKEQPVLDNLSLNIAPARMVALFGKSGEGKTTLIRLLCRMFDVQEGEVTLDGRNIKDIKLCWYRRLFAIVQQNVDVFDDSVRNNITYPNPDATDAQIVEALKAAHLDELIADKDRFPQGLETPVGERGVRLSGGEQQRVGIARAYIAILSGAKVLVLDEATSNLDSQAEKAIQEMLDNVRAKQNVSIVAIAHRISTIKKADVIYVIHDGTVAESGTHESLIAKHGEYAGLVKLQQLGDAESIVFN